MNTDTDLSTVTGISVKRTMLTQQKMTKTMMMSLTVTNFQNFLTIPITMAERIPVRIRRPMPRYMRTFMLARTGVWKSAMKIAVHTTYITI